MSLYTELKRRNVLRVAVAYLAGTWLLIQVLETVFPIFGLAETSIRIVVIMLGIGFVPALIFTWVFELTPEGIKRDEDVDRSAPATIASEKNLDRTIIVILVVALGYFAVDKFVLDPARDVEKIEEAQQQARTEALIQSYGDKSIAVLPFVNLSSDPEQEYFADGISEELLNLLAKINELRVISRSSAFSYKGKEIDIPTVGEELGVAHVLEGSVRKAGDQVRITAQLIDARSDTHLWSETYDRTLDDIFVIQDEIAAEVVDQLKLTLLGGAPKAQRANPQAYALYMQARHLANQFSDDSFIAAKPLVEQALALDSDYIPALSLAARVDYNLAEQGLLSMDDALRRERETVARMLAIDPNSADAYTWLAFFARGNDNDMHTSARYLERAFELASGDVEILRMLSGMLRSFGRLDEAVIITEYVTIHDPVCAICFWNLGRAYRMAGRIDEAEDAIRTAIALVGDEHRWNFALGNTLLLNGDAAGALSAYKSMRNSPESGDLNAQQSTGILMALHGLGQQSEFDELFKKLNTDLGDRDPLARAFVYAWTGEIDQAFTWLEKHVAMNPDVRWWVNDPLLGKLHDDARWQPLLATVGRSAEQLAAIPLKITLPPGVTLEKE